MLDQVYVRNDVSRISRSIAKARCFESIERHTRGPVADRVEVELEALAIRRIAN